MPVTRVVFFIKVTLALWLQYMICQFGVVDIARLEVLKNNSRVTSKLIFTVVANEQFYESFFIQPYQSDIAQRTLLSSSLILLGLALTAFLLRPMFLLERKGEGNLTSFRLE